MSGRGAGYCASEPLDSANPAQGFGRRIGGGFGCGGRGRGWRSWFYATGLPFWARGGASAIPPEQELAGLNNEASWLKSQLEAIQRRIADLEKKE